jgi:ribonuclease BN (tRNA processing enzyme)
MEIILLGTGTAIPARQHTPASLAVRADDRWLLLDSGPGSLSRLELAGISYLQVDRLFLTHLHPDHTLDLATLLLVFNYAPGAVRKVPFHLVSCSGIEGFLHNLFQLYPELVPVNYSLELHTVYRDEFNLGGLKVRTAPTGHTAESVAYRLEISGHSMVYSGDASPRGELVELARGADLLISECSFPSGWQTDDHLNADSLGSLAREAGVKSLLVTHRYPPAMQVDLVAQIRAQYKGQVALAVDGQRVSIGG